MTELLEIALGEYGTREYRGKEVNPKVISYFHEIGHKWVTEDEVAWCSAFINWAALKGGYERSGLLAARSWLQIGVPIKHPKLGDLVIFWREDPASWKGHVGVFITYSEDSKAIYCLGGNQGNSVSIKAYSMHKLLGFRRLRKTKRNKAE